MIGVVTNVADRPKGQKGSPVSNPPVREVVSVRDFRAIRRETERLAEPLSPEDQQIQSMPDVSPTKWHRAHVTWFFETFVLRPFLEGYEEFDEDHRHLYNSYYEAVGSRHPRHERGLISRPSCAEVTAYRQHVDAAMDRLLDELDSLDEDRDEIADLVLLGLHHEQQHQELLLGDIKHVLSKNPTHPKYHDRHREPGESNAIPDPYSWIEFGGGLVDIGFEGDGFHFDNEGPSHRVFLEPYQLSDRLITNGDWLQFMADDGYHEPRHWLSEGWAAATRHRWEAPLYWEPTNRGWHMHTLHGFVPVDPAEPVCHVSHFEADAFARWADARLPTEAEWEHASRDLEIRGNFADRGHYHPTPAEPATGGLRQMFGDVWQWTSSSYSAYPRYRPVEGAVGEYNGKFMSNQYVLRGGSCATPAGHLRRSYRNFFPSEARWVFTGLRLARDVAPTPTT